MNKKLNTIKRINRLEEYGTAFSFLLFSLLFVGAQILHPNVFHVEMIKSGADWIVHFRGQELLHIAHFLEFLCAPLLIIMALHFKKELREKSPIASFIGVIMVFIGALMLLGNKSALCLTISGFDTLTDVELQSIIPALDVLLQKEGLLAVLWLLPLLPLGWVIISVVLIKTRCIPLIQSIPIFIGSLLLANPEIEAINFFSSFFLATGLIPYFITLFKKTFNKEKEL
jgi:hypothetical protein